MPTGRSAELFAARRHHEPAAFLMGRRSQAAEEDLQDADTVETAAPVVPGSRGDARWRPAPAFPDGTCAGSALPALQKHKSAARRVGRAPLAPHRAPGARAVRLICFSGGRTRPATICQAPRRLATRDAGGDKTPRRGPSPSSASWRGRVGVARAARRDCTARASRSRSRRSRRPPNQVLLARTRPSRLSPSSGLALLAVVTAVTIMATSANNSCILVNRGL